MQSLDGWKNNNIDHQQQCFEVVNVAIWKHFTIFKRKSFFGYQKVNFQRTATYFELYAHVLTNLLIKQLWTDLEWNASWSFDANVFNQISIYFGQDREKKLVWCLGAYTPTWLCRVKEASPPISLQFFFSFFLPSLVFIGLTICGILYLGFFFCLSIECITFDDIPSLQFAVVFCSYVLGNN